jgi:heterodisulfide reductase subunit C
MTVQIRRQNTGEGLINIVKEMSGVDLSKCYQCKKCSNGCPVSGLTTLSPSEIIRRLQLGAGKEILESDLVWLCLSCGTCYERCPMQIDSSAIIDSMRSMALERRAAGPKGNIPLFNRLFLGTVRVFGRVYDLPMIAFYKLGTLNLKQDMDKFPAMLRKGKMAVLPPSGADKESVNRIFSKVKQSKGMSK